MGADVGSPGQRNSVATETKDQCWRWWDDATEESNRRDGTRAGVTNLFTVEAETTAVGPTECRLYCGRPHRYYVFKLDSLFL